MFILVNITEKNISKELLRNDLTNVKLNKRALKANYRGRISLSLIVIKCIKVKHVR